VTRRCVCRKAFLGWWHPEVDDVFFWCLAYAAEACGVHLHHAVRVSSHHHLTFTVTRKNLGEFLRLLHHQISSMLNALLEREGHEAPRELFDARGSHVMRLMDAEAQLAHLVYERVNVVDAGLADSCDGVPGRTLDPGLWKGAGVRLERPRVYVSKRRDSHELKLSPPALLYRAFGGDLDALVHHQRKLERETARVIRARRGRRARTSDEVRAIDPWDEPRTPRESSGERVPSFKTGLQGLAGRNARVRGATEVRAFREMHGAANQQWCAGNREVEYPYGTYEMRRFHGAKVAAPTADAWVSAPGPTLDDVKAELDRGEVHADEELVDRVRKVVVPQAEQTAGEDDTSEPDDSPEDRDPTERSDDPRRVPAGEPDEEPEPATQLDQRRTQRRGGDPPEG
jgi:putative transposase